MNDLKIVLYMIIISYVTFFYYDDVAMGIAVLQDFWNFARKRVIRQISNGKNKKVNRNFRFVTNKQKGKLSYLLLVVTLLIRTTNRKIILKSVLECVFLVFLLYWINKYV